MGSRFAANGQEVEVLPVPDASVLARSEVSAVSLDLKVLHPVVITRLGVFPHGPDMELRGNVTVKLFQVDQEVRYPARCAFARPCVLRFYPVRISRSSRVLYTKRCFSLQPVRSSLKGQECCFPRVRLRNEGVFLLPELSRVRGFFGPFP